jgi:heme-degrading monooxygenase HmoA
MRRLGAMRRAHRSILGRPHNDPNGSEVGPLIARIWRGATRKTDASAYVDYLRETGLREYRATPGNQGAWVLWRPADDRAEFITLSFWESRDAIRGFAGEDIERAVFYPEDDRFLVERELTVEHYEVVAAP